MKAVKEYKCYVQHQWVMILLTNPCIDTLEGKQNNTSEQVLCRVDEERCEGIKLLTTIYPGLDEWVTMQANFCVTDTLKGKLKESRAENLTRVREREREYTQTGLVQDGWGYGWSWYITSSQAQSSHLPLLPAWPKGKTTVLIKPNLSDMSRKDFTFASRLKSV